MILVCYDVFVCSIFCQGADLLTVDRPRLFPGRA